MPQMVGSLHDLRPKDTAPELRRDWPSNLPDGVQACEPRYQKSGLPLRLREEWVAFHSMNLLLKTRSKWAIVAKAGDHSHSTLRHPQANLSANTSRKTTPIQNRQDRQQ